MVKLLIILIVVSIYYNSFAQGNKDSTASMFPTRIYIHALNPQNGHIENFRRSLGFSGWLSKSELPINYKPLLNSFWRIKWQASQNLNLNFELTRDFKYGAGIGFVMRVGKKKCCRTPKVNY